MTILLKKFRELKKILQLNYQIGFTCETILDAVTYSINILRDFLVFEQLDLVKLEKNK